MSIKIGIVDDSPAIRKALRLCIESNTDWQVCGEGDDGEAAVNLVQRQNPDLLILDLSMPRMNGLDAARKIASMAPKNGIILFTIYASEELQRLAKNVGIRAIVPKTASGALLRLLAIAKEMSHVSHAA